MPTWLAIRSVVRRVTLPLRRRAAYVAAALLFTAAVPALAFSPAVLVDLGLDARFASGRLPAGGWLLVWQNLKQGVFVLEAQRLTAAGQPLGPAKDLDIGPPNVQLSISSVVVGDSGAWGVFWVEDAGADQVGVGGALFDAHDKLLQRMSFPDPIPDPGGLIISYHPLAVALSGGGFFVASEVGTQDDPTADPLQPTRTDVYVMRLDAVGRKMGDAVRVNETTQGFHRLTGVGGSKDHVVVSWDSIPGGPETTAVRARFLDGNLMAIGPEVHVAEADDSAPVFADSRLAVGSDGRAVVAWEGKEAGAGGGPSSFGVRMRAFGPAGEPRGAEHAADPSTPGDHFLSDVGLTSEGAVWVSWTTVGNFIPSAGVNESVISLRPFDLAAEPTGDAEDVATTIAAGPFLTGGRGGALVAWRPMASSTIVEGFVVGKAGGESGPPSAPFAIESLELPGFRVWVRFSPQDTASSWGTLVAPCLAQALCAAGLLPARAEVIVRLIGPKPNGFLWPQIVRFTTDPVEVWVQQKATGVTRYYLLSEGSPGSETLTGRVDRHGFRP
jgi:hypothetical protein